MSPRTPVEKSAVEEEVLMGRVEDNCLRFDRKVLFAV
jgi:hypothetical protein